MRASVLISRTSGTLLDHPRVQAGDVHTGFLESEFAAFLSAEQTTGLKESDFQLWLAAREAGLVPGGQFRSAESAGGDGAESPWKVFAKKIGIFYSAIEFLLEWDQKKIGGEFKMGAVLKLSGTKKLISSSTYSDPTEAAPAASAPRWKFDQRPGGWIIAEAETGERRRFFITAQSIHSRGLHWQGEWDDSGALTEDGSDSSAEADLTAQFPGKVRKILVQAGQNLTAGTPMLLMEAMKMEFTIRAPTDGKVAQVLITEGQQVSPGEKFFEFVPGAAGATVATSAPKTAMQSGRGKT